MAEKVYDIKRRTDLFVLNVVRFLDGLPEDYVTRTMGQQLLWAAGRNGSHV